MMGHSVGEYTALYAAESLSLHDCAILLVIQRCELDEQKKRADVMIDACKGIEGGMIAVLFCPLPVLMSLVSDLVKEGSLCEIANINSPKQIVVSGERGVLDELTRRLKVGKETRRCKVIPLNVNYPFHCSVMKPAALELDQFVHDSLQKHDIEIRNPKVPVLSNVDSYPVRQCC